MQPGQEIGGRYRLVRPLRPGGRKHVWCADHLALGSQVAVHFLGQADEARLAHVARASTAAAGLRSQNVAQVLDHGVHDGVPFVVLELLEGQSLEERLRKATRLPIADVAVIVAQIGRALSKAHAAGLAHGDLRPHNVFLTKNDDEEVAKVLDLGLAPAPSPGWTPSHEALLYASPAVLRGEPYDAASDLWALAVVAYQCVTGKLPFAGVRAQQVLARLEKGEPAPHASRARPGVPGAFDVWFDRATALDKTARFGAARELCDALIEASKGPVEVRASTRPPPGGVPWPSKAPPAPVVPRSPAMPTFGAPAAAKGAAPPRPPTPAKPIPATPRKATPTAHAAQIVAPAHPAVAPAPDEVDDAWGDEDAADARTKEPKERTATMPLHSVPPAALGALVGATLATAAVPEPHDPGPHVSAAAHGERKGTPPNGTPRRATTPPPPPVDVVADEAPAAADGLPPHEPRARLATPLPSELLDDRVGDDTADALEAGAVLEDLPSARALLEEAAKVDTIVRARLEAVDVNIERLHVARAPERVSRPTPAPVVARPSVEVDIDVDLPPELDVGTRARRTKQLAVVAAVLGAVAIVVIVVRPYATEAMSPAPSAPPGAAAAAALAPPVIPVPIAAPPPEPITTAAAVAPGVAASAIHTTSKKASGPTKPAHTHPRAQIVKDDEVEIPAAGGDDGE
jgi:serine/threonine-protein kinase